MANGKHPYRVDTIVYWKLDEGKGWINWDADEMIGR